MLAMSAPIASKLGGISASSCWRGERSQTEKALHEAAGLSKSATFLERRDSAQLSQTRIRLAGNATCKLRPLGENVMSLRSALREQPLFPFTACQPPLSPFQTPARPKKRASAEPLPDLCESSLGRTWGWKLQSKPQSFDGAFPTVCMAAAAEIASTSEELRTRTAALFELDKNGTERLAFRPDGYNYWPWRGHRIHYVVEGEGPPLVLVHGFGASAFHWRYNIPALAKHFKVYAIDMLGFGWSDKAVVDYDMSLWSTQLSDFTKEVIGEPAILAGNSVGGFTVLATAAHFPESVTAVVLLNAAGKFEDDQQQQKGQADAADAADAEPNFFRKNIITPILRIFQRLSLLWTFNLAKQPSRLKSVLQNVYVDKTNVDDYLINSILLPSQDPNAGEVYCRVGISALINSSYTTLDRLLEKLDRPLLLLWGDLDPWMDPTKAARIMSLYPRAEKISLQAGHCPHDEVPEQFNKALIQWAAAASLCSPDLNLT